MAQIHVIVVNALGSFAGTMQSTGELTAEEAKDAVAALVSNVESVDRLVLVDIEGRYVALQETILRQSVMTFWTTE